MHNLKRKKSNIFVFHSLLTIFVFFGVWTGLCNAQEPQPNGSATAETMDKATTAKKAPPPKPKTADEEDNNGFDPDDLTIYSIFDDKMLLDGYTEKYRKESKEVIFAMIGDETLNAFKSAAAVRVFKEEYSRETFSREKKLMEKTLLRKLNRTDSPYVQIEIMAALCYLDRYKYFKSMIPALIQKLDHYNSTVNAIAYQNLNTMIKSGHNRAREARIVFNTLRKVLFLSRRRLASMKEADERLSQKLKILRWSIKVLGNQELKRLPKEVIHLL